MGPMFQCKVVGMENGAAAAALSQRVKYRAVI